MKKLVFLSMFLTVSLCFHAQVNDLCGNSQLLVVDAPCISGSTIGAGVEDQSIDPVLYPADVWYSFEATTNYSVVYIYPDMDVDPDLYMFDNCGGNVFAVGTAGVVAGETDSVLIESVPGANYYIAVVGWQDAPYGNFCIEVLSRNIDVYDPCSDFVNLTVGDPCYADHFSSDSLVKTYTFTASSYHTFVSLDIQGLCYLPAIAAFEDGCSGAMIRDWMDGYSLQGSHFMVDFPTVIGQSYLFGVINTDPSFSYQFPMDYCVKIENLAELTAIQKPVIQLSPNPVSDRLTVDMGDNLGEVEVLDLSARSLCRSEGSGSICIEMAAFPSGVYFVKTTIGQYSQQQKILKQ